MRTKGVDQSVNNINPSFIVEPFRKPFCGDLNRSARGICDDSDNTWGCFEAGMRFEYFVTVEPDSGFFGDCSAGPFENIHGPHHVSLGKGCAVICDEAVVRFENHTHRNMRARGEKHGCDNGATLGCFTNVNERGRDPVKGGFG